MLSAALQHYSVLKNGAHVLDWPDSEQRSALSTALVRCGVQRRSRTLLMATVPSRSCWRYTCHSQFVHGSGALARVVLDYVVWVCLMEC